LSTRGETIAPDSDSLGALRESLPPLPEADQNADHFGEYLRFYGLDFEQQFPGLSHRVGRIQSGDFALAAHRWELEGATRNMLVVHGYTDHSGLFGHLIEFGLNQGCNVIAFDLPGHGLSSGDPVAIDNFSDYSQAIVDVLAQSTLPELPWWVMAQSTGCAALIDYAGKYPWPFTGAVFLAPLIRPAGWGRVRLGYALLHRFRDSIARNFNANSGDKAFLAFMREDPLQAQRLPLRWIGALRRWLAALEYRDLGVGPLLVIQGDADGTVDWRYNMKRMVKLFPKCQIEYLPGAGHQLANETEKYRREYLQKVAQFLRLEKAPLNSTAGQG
jgi:lysophospholipase